MEHIHMESSEFLNMLTTRRDKMREDATRLLLNGDTYRAAAAAGQVQCCQDLEREIKFRLEAVERMRAEAADKLRKREERKEARRALKNAASAEPSKVRAA